MFKMKVEKQLNLPDRTLLLGTPEFDVIPKSIVFEGNEIKIIGISSGIKLPNLSLEIEKTEVDLFGKTITEKSV